MSLAAKDFIKRYFRFRYILALSLVALLSVCSFLMLRQVIRSNESSAAIINFAGKRRFLSQKAGFHSLMLLHAKNPHDRMRARMLLQSTVKALEQAHQGLIHGNPELGLPGNPSAQMKEFYYGTSALDATVRNYIELCKQWSVAPLRELNPDNPILAQILFLGPNEVLVGLDKAVSMYQDESEEQIARLESIELLVLLCTLLLLIMEAFLIFKPMESELEDAKKDAAQSFKMASIGEMSAGIVHEINSPLTVIGARASLIKKQAESGQLQTKSLIDGVIKIEAMIENVSKIINSIKSISRDESDVAMESVTLSSIVENVVELSRLKLRGAEVELIIDSSVRSIRLRCHPSEICQILLNLVSNSVDAIRNSSARWIKIEATRSIDGLDISVTDSGRGIPKELQDKILQPFFSTKPSGSGVGLGLSIATKLTKKHNGRLFIDENCEHTRFVLHLPPEHAVASTGS